MAVVLQIPVQSRTDRHTVVAPQDELVSAAFDLEYVAPLVGGDDFNEECIGWQHAPHEIAGRLFWWHLSLRRLRDEHGSKNPTYQTGFYFHGLADWFRDRLNCPPMRALFNVPDPKVKTDELPLAAVQLIYRHAFPACSCHWPPVRRWRSAPRCRILSPDHAARVCPERGYLRRGCHTSCRLAAGL